MIVREAAAVAIPGLAAGMAISLAGARWMESLVYRVPVVDPLSL